MTSETRWKYRFTNFSRAFALLRDALEPGVEALNQLEREGVIQRFEYDGIVFETVTPRSVIRQAFQSGLIADGETWLDMLTDRNPSSHTYDAARVEAVLTNIHGRYLAVLNDLHLRRVEESIEP